MSGSAWEIQGRDALSSTSGATGMQTAPWNQGDFVVSFAAEATSGSRTAPTGAMGIPPLYLALGVAAVFVGAVLWRRFK